VSRIASLAILLPAFLFDPGCYIVVFDQMSSVKPIDLFECSRAECCQHPCMTRWALRKPLSAILVMLNRDIQGPWRRSKGFFFCSSAYDRTDSTDSFVRIQRSEHILHRIFIDSDIVIKVIQPGVVCTNRKIVTIPKLSAPA